MKKYKSILDGLLLIALFLLTFVCIAPERLLMPTDIQMILLGIVFIFVSSFLVLVWREQPSDEREQENQYLASRYAYLVGSGVLLFFIVYQGSKHHIDSALPFSLLCMIATKLIIQNTKNKT